MTLDCDSQLRLLSVKVCYALHFTEAALGGRYAHWIKMHVMVEVVSTKYALHSDKRTTIVVALGLQSQIGSETKAKS